MKLQGHKEATPEPLSAHVLLGQAQYQKVELFSKAYFQKLTQRRGK
jgi:hypothetical protein